MPLRDAEGNKLSTTDIAREAMVAAGDLYVDLMPDGIAYNSLFENVLSFAAAASLLGSVYVFFDGERGAGQWSLLIAATLFAARRFDYDRDMRRKRRALDRGHYIRTSRLNSSFFFNAVATGWAASSFALPAAAGWPTDTTYVAWSVSAVMVILCGVRAISELSSPSMRGFSFQEWGQVLHRCMLMPSCMPMLLCKT